MKKTALEWLFDKINIFGGSKDLYMFELLDMFEQAKAMEKKQIKNAYKKGYNEGSNAANYINETFKPE